MLMILAMIPFVAMTVSAAGNFVYGDTFAAGGINYMVMSTNPKEVKISTSVNATGVINIPETVTGTDSNTYAVTEIGNNAFENSAITDITIPATVLKVREFAFSNCSQLKTAEMNGENTYFENSIFSNCTNLEKVIVNIKTLTSYADGVFVGCNKLTSITIGKDIKTVDTNVHLMIISAPNLSEIKIDNNSNFISSNGILFDKNMETLVIYPAKKTETDYTVPSTVNTIGEASFASCTNIKNVILPTSVGSIEEAAFDSCTSLSSVTFKRDTPPSTIGEDIFMGVPYSNFTVYVPAGKTAAYAAKLKDTIVDSNGDAKTPKIKQADDITFTKDGITYQAISSPNEVRVIKPVSGTYSGDIDIPSTVLGTDNNTYTVTGIYGSAFKNSSITDITIPATVTSIGKWAFSNCSQLISAEINGGENTKLYDEIFIDCGNLENVTINIKSIYDSIYGKNMFKGCNKLRSVTIGKDVSSIGMYMLDSADSLSEIKANNNQNYSSDNGILFNTNKTALVFYPPNKSGTEYTIPSTVSKLCMFSVYENANLEKITISSSVTKIEALAFGSSKELKSVIFNGDTPPEIDLVLNDGIFYNVPYDSLTIHVPVGKISGYTTALKNSITVVDTDHKFVENKTPKIVDDVIIKNVPDPIITSAPVAESQPSIEESTKPNTEAPSVSNPTSETKTKTIIVVETPKGIAHGEAISVEPIGEAFDDSIEVRLKDNAEEEEIIRQALADKTLDVISDAEIFPLDISMYIKGTDTKVQPNEGTSVKITIPIPEILLANKEKIVIVCVVDGKLQVLPTKVVLKDGVYCVVFTASHFSPYAFVVDKDGKLATLAAGAPITDNAIPIYANGLPYTAFAIALTILGMGYKRKKIK